MTATTINRTPFRPVGEIPARLLASDKLKWHMPDSVRVVHFTTDGKHFGYEHDVGASSGLWSPVMPEHVFRPVGMTWEAAREAVCNMTANSPSPQPAQQPKAEEPFRPGLPPAELRAVCKEWEWSAGVGVRPVDFVGDYYRFLNNVAEKRKSPSELAAAYNWVVGKRNFFRPLGRTWADIEAEAAAEAATRRQPGKVGNYAHVNYTPRRTFIIASPPGRRKYVKLLLKRLGYRNVDKIPTTDKQTPFDLGRSLPDHERENLLAIAPGIVLRDVL